MATSSGASSVNFHPLLATAAPNAPRRAFGAPNSATELVLIQRFNVIAKIACGAATTYSVHVKMAARFFRSTTLLAVRPQSITGSAKPTRIFVVMARYLGMCQDVLVPPLSSSLQLMLTHHSNPSLRRYSCGDCFVAQNCQCFEGFEPVCFTDGPCFIQECRSFPQEQAWNLLVGTTCDPDAINEILADYPGMDVQCDNSELPDSSNDRVRIRFDPATGLVSEPPRVG